MKESTYLKPGLRRYVANYLAIAITMLGSFASYRLCFHFYGESALELYAVSRRMLTYGIAFVASGLGASLCYHVAEDHAQGENRAKLSFLSAGLPLALLLLGVGAFTVLFPERVGHWLFGTGDHGNLALPLLSLMISISIQLVLDSFFSGRMQIVQSSGLSAVNSGVIPLMSFFLFPHSLVSFFWGTALLGTLSSIVFFVIFVSPTVEETVDYSRLSSRMMQIVSYAASRIPGGFLIAVILNLPVSFATHTSKELTAAAALSVGVALVGLVAAGVTPLANIYLPQTAYLAARGKVHELWSSSVRVFLLITVCTTLYVIGLTVFCQEFLTLILGSPKLGYAPFVVRVLPAAPFYAYFRCFRGFLDGVSRRPLTTYNTLISLGVFLIVQGAPGKASLAESASSGLVFAMAALGLLTLGQTFWYLRQPTDLQDDSSKGA